ncbi:hypothetical protein [Hyphomicrobium sp.]|uniref:hypothetical protein n=1 Tax=Hyphomicrobium sp. TaxID=82 RepID=UPI003F6F8B66
MVHAQNHWAETVYDTRPSDFSFNVVPDERVGAGVPRASASRVAIRFVIAVALSAAWAAAVTTADLKSVLSTAEPAVAAVIEKARGLAARVHAAGTQPEAVAGSPSDLASGPLSGEAVSQMPPVLSALPMQEDTSGPTADPGAAASEPAGTDYTDTAVAAEEPAEKKERRTQAASAGLSPDLPNVLLSRLSKEDFKNAAYAIKTAIAKTADDAKFVWPLAPSRNQAKFEVHFVAGAESGCRRYVVTVTKDRWSSTSAALERCGATMARAS